jgi:hypothetical protein
MGHGPLQGEAKTFGSVMETENPAVAMKSRQALDLMVE